MTCPPGVKPPDSKPNDPTQLYTKRQVKSIYAYYVSKLDSSDSKPKKSKINDQDGSPIKKPDLKALKVKYTKNEDKDSKENSPTNSQSKQRRVLYTSPTTSITERSMSIID